MKGRDKNDAINQITIIEFISFHLLNMINTLIFSTVKWFMSMITIVDNIHNVVKPINSHSTSKTNH